MTERHNVCSKEADFSAVKADIRVLEKATENNETQIEKIEKKYETMNDLGTAISVMSVSLDHMVEHNKKQDIMFENSNKTLENINNNLNELNEGQRNLNHEQKSLNSKVAKLEERVEENESKSKINLLDIAKDERVNAFKKYATPAGFGAAGAAILAGILQIIEALKG